MLSVIGFALCAAAVSVLLRRALGLCLTTQFACDVCKDAGETAIAARLETAGRAALLLLAMPLFSLLLEQALSLLGC